MVLQRILLKDTFGSDIVTRCTFVGSLRLEDCLMKQFSRNSLIAMLLLTILIVALVIASSIWPAVEMLLLLITLVPGLMMLVIVTIGLCLKYRDEHGSRT